VNERSKRSAGFVVVRESADGWRFLLLRAYKLWDFPKGLVEPGEDPLATARRETLEEAGIADLELRWGEAYCETAPYSGNKIARYYLGCTRTEAVTLGVNPTLGRPEHHEYRWVTFEQAVALLPARLQGVIAWAGELLGLQARA
jgi:8-oxo-dGTP pyrophosphatase MutT (NUDIX family)